MAILNFVGFEQGNNRSTNGSDEHQPPTSGASVQSTIKKNGTYSMEFDKVTTATPFVAFPIGYLSNGLSTNDAGILTCYFTGYFRYTSKPASGNDTVWHMQGGGNDMLSLNLASDGTLKLYKGTTGSQVLLGTSSTSLSQDTWYRIGIKVVADTSGSYELKINGSSEISGSSGWDTNAPALNIIYLGNIYDRNSLSFKFYWDDVVADDANYIDVDYAVGILKPNANGSTMTWNGGTGASDYTQVDEIPVDDADYVTSPNSGAPNVALMNFQSRSDAGITNSTIYAIKAVIITKEQNSATSATLIRVRSGSTNSDSGTLNGTTSTQGRNRVLSTDPDTGSAWTNSAVDAIEAGAVENNNVLVRMVNAMVYVLYAVSTSVNYPMTASQGSLTLTGQSALLKIGKKLLAVFGSFALSGQTVLLKLGRKMLAVFGSFALNGQNAILKSTRKIVASLGTFTLTGVAVGLRIGKGILATYGTFALNGQNAIITSTRKIVVVYGSFVLSGQNAILRVGKMLQAVFGSFVLTSQSVNFRLNRLLTAIYGQFALTGQAVGLFKGKIMQAVYGTFALTSQSTLFKFGRKMLATYTTFTLAGQSAILKLGKGIIASTGTFVLTGQSILFHVALKLRAVYGQFTLNGQVVRFALNGLYIRWNNAVKNSATYQNIAKNVASWVNRNKNL